VTVEEFPAVEWTAPDRIGAALRAVIGADLRAACARRVDGARGARPDVQVLFWLHWEVAGKELAPSRPISPAWIAAWHAACAELLAACRELPQLRVFCLLPVQAEAEHHEAIRGLGTSTVAGVHGLGLHAVGDVALDDLVRFMTQPANTPCREDEAEYAARGLFAHHKGAFAETCAAIETANRDGYDRWVELGRSLPSAHSNPSQEF
jgi:hypothetical protein